MSINVTKVFKTKTRTGPKHGVIFGLRIDSTNLGGVTNFVTSRLKNKEKFYIVSVNPEILLKAKKDWLLNKTLHKSDLSVPDGIGVAQAVKFLRMGDYKGSLIRIPLIFLQVLKVGLSTFFDKDWLMKDFSVIKGRELFLQILKIANDKSLKVFFVGGQNNEAGKTIEKLKEEFKNITFKTSLTPKYNKNGQPDTEGDRKMHKALIGKIKLFEPDLVFVGMTTPIQEKWIYRNFFRLKATGAMTVGGTFNYISGLSKLPPKWVERVDIEFLWRLITEPYRIFRIINAVIVFPWTVFLYKINPPKR